MVQMIPNVVDSVLVLSVVVVVAVVVDLVSMVVYILVEDAVVVA